MTGNIYASRVSRSWSWRRVRKTPILGRTQPKSAATTRSGVSELSIADLFLEVPGGTVFARSWTPNGDGGQNATPLILIHDSLGCVGLWRDFPAALAQHLNRPVFVYDRLGFGKSSPRDALPGPNFIHEEAEVIIPAIRQKLGITQFVSLGHSVGGTMALLSAAQAGADCQGVISESAPVFVEARTVTGIEQAVKQFEEPEQFDRLRKWHGDKARWVLDAWDKVWRAEAFANWSLTPFLANVKCPVLAIHGDRDEYGSIRFPEAICEHVGGFAQMEILKEIGHVPHRENPALVIELVAKFLQNPGRLRSDCRA
jgi:pimeloyl-ACP methyl ester carboxylesterase